jgi:hypothetical protein
MIPLVCFATRYKDSQKEEPSLTVSEIFQKYMLKNTEPFLFYCKIPPYTRSALTFVQKYTTYSRILSHSSSTVL